MSDIVERLGELASVLKRGPDYQTIILAADEITRLRAENKRLKGGQSTHYEGCYDAGRNHYECALRRVTELEACLGDMLSYDSDAPTTIQDQARQALKGGA